MEALRDGGQTLLRAIHHGVEEGLLTREVVVERAFFNAGRRREVADRRARESPGREGLLGGVHESGPRVAHRTHPPTERTIVSLWAVGSPVNGSLRP